MDVGVYVDAHLGIGEQALALERAGFSHLWVYDSPLVFGEPYLAMLEAARATERIKIGPGVTQPLARPPFAAAQAIGTLAKAAPGRIFFGIGIGNSARWSLGQRPASLDTMFDHLRVVRGLLDGETVEHAGRPIRFMHPHGRWLELDYDVPVWVSAFGPKGQRRAGAAGVDGVLVRWEGEDALAAVREQIDAGAREGGHDPERIQVGVVYAVYPIESEAELDTDEARGALGPLVVSRLRYLTANHTSSAEVPEPFRPGFDAYLRHRESLDDETRHFDNYEGYLAYTPAHLESFVTPESIRTVVHAESAAGVTAELQRMADAGVGQATLQIAGPPPSWCERMGADVLPGLVPATGLPGESASAG
jgi:alkanesulfonate monooxygenase SsuD/methylene tetrahydromethanopterin reductase-like flavin-dependent oxidoreductase (luciferase family)